MPRVTPHSAGATAPPAEPDPAAVATDPGCLAALVRSALASAGLPDQPVVVERPRHREHGDWATNVAMTLAKPVGKPPREIAEAVVAHLGTPTGVETVEVAGPGFINFGLSWQALRRVVVTAVSAGSGWGRSDQAEGRSAHVEFVSANPTGPLHVGHARWAASGDALASLLEATGWRVWREYYVNDAGTQLEMFGASVAAAAAGKPPPEDGYHGAYVTELADELQAAGEPDANGAGEAPDETHGELTRVTEAAYRRMLTRIHHTLERLGVAYDEWFSEASLHDSGAVDEAIERFSASGLAYRADDALWLAATAYGDDKDRVLVRSDGRPTYFAADCAYLASKAARDFDRCVYLLGADHHGYTARLLAAARALGIEPERVEVVIGQLVNLSRGGQPLAMGKRSGSIVTADELVDEVGADAARYTFLRTSLETPVDFDVAEVTRHSQDNPVFYVQYSHARIAGIVATATQRGLAPHGGEAGVDEAALAPLTHEAERELIRRIAAYPEAVARAAEERAPHRVARYAETLAEGFHKFYTECQVVGDDEALTRARYWLCVATRQTLVNALGLLGVSAPEQM